MYVNVYFKHMNASTSRSVEEADDFLHYSVTQVKNENAGFLLPGAIKMKYVRLMTKADEPSIKKQTMNSNRQVHTHYTVSSVWI